MAATIFWGIWRKRNNRIFSNSARSFEHTFYACFTFISYWLSLLSGKSRDLAARIIGHIQTGGTSDNQSEDMKCRETTRHRRVVTSDFSHFWLLFNRLTVKSDLDFKFNLYFVSGRLISSCSLPLCLGLYIFCIFFSPALVCASKFYSSGGSHMIRSYVF